MRVKQVDLDALERIVATSGNRLEFGDAPQIRRAIAELRAMAWKPIADAPKDEWILLDLDWRGVKLGRRSRDPEYAWEFFEENHAESKNGLNFNAVNETPRGWMPRPIPAPPEGV